MMLTIVIDIILQGQSGSSAKTKEFPMPAAPVRLSFHEFSRSSLAGYLIPFPLHKLLRIHQTTLKMKTVHFPLAILIMRIKAQDIGSLPQCAVSLPIKNCSLP